jgi:hypothetical protein
VSYAKVMGWEECQASGTGAGATRDHEVRHLKRRLGRK